MSADLPEVFVGCSTEGLPAAKAIQNNLQYTARVSLWPQGTFELTHTVLEDLVRAAERSDFAVFVLYQDDITKSRGSDEPSPRDNTIFEAGLFMGMLGRERVFLVKPRDVKVKLPTDLSGITLAPYLTPADDRWEPALGPATNQIEAAIKRRGRRMISSTHPTLNPGPHHVYSSLREAAREVAEACRSATDIKVLANKGLIFVGTDDSIISTAEIHLYSKLRKLRVLLMSPDSRWITKGFVSLRMHESLETYIRDLEASHRIVESGVRQFAARLAGARSGVRYFTGEPFWRVVMTENAAFVSNYADDQIPQVRDLPVSRFENEPGSFYSAFKRQFNNIWHNESKPGTFMRTTIDLSISAGGIVYADISGQRYVLLLRRHDGFWVLPKGHRKLEDSSLEVTALREVSEESGIPPTYLQVEDQLDTYTDDTHELEREHKVVYIYAIRYLGAELSDVRPDVDHAEARWWPVSKPFPEMLYPYQATLVAEFAKYRSQVSKQ